MNIEPGGGGRFFLGLLPFLLLIILYLLASADRHALNPDDKLLPSLSQMGDAIYRVAIEPDRRTGAVLLWKDSASSLMRLAFGLGLATLIGLCFGIAIGVIPLARNSLAPLVAILSMIPPMAVLPILFIVFGLGELSKVVLIVIGVAPFLIRDLSLHVSGLPPEQLVKAQTLGGSTWQIILRVVLPQTLPRLIEAVRLSLGPAFLFLIAAEAIAAEDGLGYRIFLLRRYLSMDVILPYVAWITLLAYFADLLLSKLSRSAFSWAYVDERRT